MTVTNPTVIYSYPANGATVNFPYPQAFIAQTDLRVLLLDVTGKSLAPPPVLNGGATYDYHVTGAPDSDTGAYPAGGAVVFNNAPALPAATVQIARIVPITQPVNFIDDAAIAADTLNLELDRLTMIAQQLNNGLYTGAVGGAPPPANPSAAGQVPAVKSDGTGYEMRTALLLSQSDLTAFDATAHRIENLAAPAAATDAATRGYADTGDAATLAAANGHADAGDTATRNFATAGDTATLTSAKSYADAGDAATLTSAKSFATAGDTATLTSAKSYADAGDATTLTSSKSYTDAKVSGTGSVPAPLAGDAGKPLTATGAGAYSWQSISAAALNLGTRLSANGTQLNALGPTWQSNQPVAGTTAATAVDGAINTINSPGANYTWTLPPVTAGACLTIQLSDNAHSCTIRPAGSDVIPIPSDAVITNASPLVIPPIPNGTYATIVLSGRPSAWDVLSVAPNIADALNWRAASGAVLPSGYIGNPTGTTSGSLVMMGMGAANHITPKSTGRVLFCIAGMVGNNAAGAGAEFNGYYGTGTPPVNGAAPSGVGIFSIGTLGINSMGAGVYSAFTVIGVAQNLTPGTQYWFDIGLEALTAGTAQIVNAGGFAVEL